MLASRTYRPNFWGDFWLGCMALKEDKPTLSAIIFGSSDRDMDFFTTVISLGWKIGFQEGSKFSQPVHQWTADSGHAMLCQAMPLSVNVGGRIFQASEDTLRRCGQFLLRAYLWQKGTMGNIRKIMGHIWGNHGT